MPAVLRMTVDERRARLGVRHRLAAGARIDDAVAIADSVVALHATDPATVFLSAAARMITPSVERLEKALYDDRVLVRTLCMRRTMFVLPVSLVPVVQAACTDALVPGERRRTLAMLEAAGVADADRQLRELEAATCAAVEEAGEATGAELSKLVPGLARKLVVGVGTTWEGTVGMTTRVLFLLSTEQKVARGRPKGGWTSSATGTSTAMPRRCSTRTATPSPPCGPTDASWAAGPNGRAPARWCSGFWRTSAVKCRPPSRPKPPASPSGSAPYGSLRASPRPCRSS